MGTDARPPRISDAVASLLAAVSARKVHLVTEGLTKGSSWRAKIPGGHRRVTDAIGRAETDQLVKVGQRPTDDGAGLLWELTDTGRDALAAHRATRR